MKKLKPNYPGFKMNSGKFNGRRYVHGVVYQDSEIPGEHKDKFTTVRKTAPAKSTGQGKNKEEKSK